MARTKSRICTVSGVKTSVNNFYANQSDVQTYGSNKTRRESVVLDYLLVNLRQTQHLTLTDKKKSFLY